MELFSYQSTFSVSYFVKKNLLTTWPNKRVSPKSTPKSPQNTIIVGVSANKKQTCPNRAMVTKRPFIAKKLKPKIPVSFCFSFNRKHKNPLNPDLHCLAMFRNIFFERQTQNKEIWKKVLAHNFWKTQFQKIAWSLGTKKHKIIIECVQRIACNHSKIGYKWPWPR